MTNEEYCEIMDKSNFLIDSANPYDMEIKNALEKQIPKEPIIVHVLQENDRGYLACPICKTGTLVKEFDKFCWWCGQAIKWD